MNPGLIVAFWAVAFLLIITPGPDWAFTLSATRILPAVAGLAAGYGIVTAVVAAGVGALVVAMPGALAALSVVGGIYLLWHGATTLAKPPKPNVAQARTLLTGIGVSTLNPKGLLMFLALMPQFTDGGASWPIAAQLGMLGLIFTLTCVAFYLCLGLFARAVLRLRPAATRALRAISGVSMMAIGITLLIGTQWGRFR